jgi:hypothetical protein
VAWLVWQLAVPAAYYLGDDVSEERFSWRMFSGVFLHHKRCVVSVSEAVAGPGTRPSLRKVDLSGPLTSWIGLLKQNRRLVVEKVLRTRCQNDPLVIAVQFRRRCPFAPEARMPTVVRRLNCRTGVFADVGATP